MNNNINLKLYGIPYYKITGDNKSKKIICHKECLLKIYDEKFLIQKKGTVHCKVDGLYDEELLKTQAWAQASVKIGHEVDTLIEVYMAKKSMRKIDVTPNQILEATRKYIINIEKALEYREAGKL